MKTLWLGLAVVGFLVPYTAFVAWLVEHGVDPSRFVADLFANGVSAFFGLDVLVSAAVVIVLAVRGQRRGVPHAWLAVLGTLTVGVSFGLPLYLFLEARSPDASGG